MTAANAANAANAPLARPRTRRAQAARVAQSAHDGHDGHDGQPRGCTQLRLRQFQRQLQQHYDAELAKAGLKTTQYSLLSFVVRLGPVAPGVLARSMKMQPSTLTRNLRPLVQAGWISLGAGADARSRSVAATDAGRDKRSEAQRRWKAAQRQVNALLGPQRVDALHGLVDECLQILSDGPTVTGAGGHGG
jgi:DNA-binding MarR family transcriptional regulator